MKRKLKTPTSVLEMTCGQFRQEYLPSKTSMQYTQAGMFFHERITWVNFDNWKDEPLSSVILIFQQTTPEEMLKYRGAGMVRLKTLIEAFQCVGIDLDDIPEYKKWLKAQV